MANKTNVLNEGVGKIRTFAKQNTKRLAKGSLYAFIGSGIFVIGIILAFQFVITRFTDSNTIYLATTVQAYLHFGIVAHILIWGAITIILIRFAIASQKDYHMDEALGINVADNSVDTLLSTEDDLSEHFNIGTVDETDNNIFGCTDGEYNGNTSWEVRAGKTLVSMNFFSRDENMNLVCFGLAGAGKSRKKVINDICQIIKRGESFVCTDTKGALVSDLYWACKANGYNVKIINHKPSEAGYSDAIDIFSLLGDYEKIKLIPDAFDRETAINVAVDMCNDIAQCIKENLDSDVKSRGKDFWEKEGLSYIKFWVKFIFFNEAIPKEEKHFGKILWYLQYYKVRHTSEKGDAPVNDGSTSYVGYVQDLASQIEASPILKKTCSYDFSIFCAGTDTVKDSIHGGLSVDLQPFNSDLLQQITRHNEIDLSLPAKEKCAYFFVIDTISDKNKFLTSTTFTLLYKQLYAYIEGKPNGQNYADVPVTIIYDEFLNIGVVPKIVKYIQTARSYLIRHELFVQTLSDFKEVYEETTMESILSNCAYWMLIKSEEQELLERFSAKSGHLTEVIEQQRKSINRTNPFKDFAVEVQESTQCVDRAVLLESEIRKLKNYEMLVLKNGADMARVKTWDCSSHPIMKGAVVVNGRYDYNHDMFSEEDKELYFDKKGRYAKYSTNSHYPLWRVKSKLASAEKEKKEKEFWGEGA